MSKQIVIVGTAPSSIRLGPYANPDWEVWACSPGTYGVLPRINQFFELHRWEPGQPWFSEGYCDFLRAFNGPVWMSAPVNEVKGCVVLPVDALVQKYSPYFFTSSIAWMMAMAIEAGATKIALYGVDMAATEEYGYQRAGCQFFAMLAKAKGIEVGVPPESDLLRPAPLYGVCEQNHGWIKALAREQELRSRLKECETTQQNKMIEAHFLKGALDDLNWNRDTWHGNMDGRSHMFTEPTDIPALKDFDHSIFPAETASQYVSGCNAPDLTEPFNRQDGKLP